MLPENRQRVVQTSPEEYNRRIRARTEENIRRYATADRATLDRRLKQLDEEWDIERAIETEASLTALVGLALGLGLDRRFLVIPAAVGGMLLMHAATGWCPPVTLLRRMGIRSFAEINEERYALKAARGDFQEVEQAAAEERYGSRGGTLLHLVQS